MSVTKVANSCCCDVVTAKRNSCSRQIRRLECSSKKNSLSKTEPNLKFDRLKKFVVDVSRTTMIGAFQVCRKTFIKMNFYRNEWIENGSASLAQNAFYRKTFCHLEWFVSPKTENKIGTSYHITNDPRRSATNVDRKTQSRGFESHQIRISPFDQYVKLLILSFAELSS